MEIAERISTQSGSGSELTKNRKSLDHTCYGVEARVELLDIQSDDLTRTAGIKLDEDSVGYKYMALFEASVRLAKDEKTIN